MIDTKALKKFCDQLVIANTVNFPRVAREQGLDWFQELKPLYDNTAHEFRPMLINTLLEIKFGLVDQVLRAASGVGRHEPTPSSAHMRSIVNFIDAFIDGKALQEETAEEEDEEALKQRRARLGLIEDDDE